MDNAVVGSDNNASPLMEYMRTIVIKPHIASDETQFDLKVNDIVYVLEQDETGWWGGHKEGEDCTGWFPGSCVRILMEQQAPAQRDGISASCGGAGATDAGFRAALETSQESPIRQSRVVASPFRAATARAEEEKLVFEGAQLNDEVVELNEAIQHYERQSLADRRKSAEMESSVSRERDKKEQLQRALQAESTETNSLSATISVLCEQLEKERRNSQVQKEATETMRALYESKLRDKDEELRVYQESGRKSLQNERQRIRHLEEQVRNAQEEISTTQREKRDSMISLGSTMPIGAVLGTAVPDSRGVPRKDVGCGAPADDTARRRLFSSAAGLEDVTVPPLSSKQAPGGYENPSAASGASQRIASNGPMRGPGRPRHPSPGLAHSHSESGFLSMQSVDNTGQRFPGKSGDEEEAERAPRGCVLEKVSLFEKRCRSQTPRRDAVEACRASMALRSAVRSDGVRAASIPPFSGHAATVPSLPQEVDFGMSPIKKDKSYEQEPCAMVSALSTSLVPRLPATWAPDGGDAGESLDPEPRVSTRKSLIPEVPVSERIRQLQRR
jgi:hypothetical protein